MAFVGDDEVEGLDGDGGVVLRRRGCVDRRRRSRSRISRRGLRQFFAAEHGVKALDGADGDARDRVEPVRGEVLDVVELGELAAGVRGDELLELGEGLAAEIGAVDEEEDVARAGSV